MKVWVVMGNDYPDSVFATEAAAETYVAEKKKEKTEQLFGHARIHWRAYEFEVRL